MKNNAFISHSSKHFENLNELKKYKSIRSILGEFTGLGNIISFRNNTTTAIIDVLQILMQNRDYKVIIADIEHPCVQNIINAFIPKNRIVYVKVYHFLLSGQYKELEAEISKDYGSNHIYLFSHVLWNCGLILDIEYMSAKIKNHGKNNLVLIDGAQAVGNIPQLLKEKGSRNNIDFYFGCTHKWLETERLLGFVIINNSVIEDKIDLAYKIFLKDMFSIYAGSIPNFSLKIDYSTYDTSLLLELTQSLNLTIKNFIFPKNISVVKFDKYDVTELSDITYYSNRFYAVYGKLSELQEIVSLLKINSSFILEDLKLPQNNYWLRVER